MRLIMKNTNNDESEPAKSKSEEVTNKRSKWRV